MYLDRPMEYFIEAIRRYSDFLGKSTRSQFWGFQVFATIFTVVLNQLDIQSGSWSEEYGIGLFSGLYTAGILVPSLAILSRRLHDAGKSGWMGLLLLIPIVGWVWVGILLFQPSKS